MTSGESRRGEAWNLQSKYQAGNGWGCLNGKSKVDALKILRCADKPQRVALIDLVVRSGAQSNAHPTATHRQVVSEPVRADRESRCLRERERRGGRGAPANELELNAGPQPDAGGRSTRA
jgi:hypothetical protein